MRTLNVKLLAMVTAFVVTGFAPASYAADRCESVFTFNEAIVRAAGAVEVRLSNNKFAIDRGFADYQRAFRSKTIPSLTEFIHGLDDGEIWLDAGAGEARAQRDILSKSKDRNFTGSRNIQFVAVAYQKPDNPRLLRDIEENSGQLQYLDGGYIEEMINQSGSELSKMKDSVRLITEFYGPLSYTKDIAAVLNSYADLLELGGSAILQFDERFTQIFAMNGTMRRQFFLKDAPDLISKMTGGRLVVRKAESSEDRSSYSILWLEKVSDERAPQASPALKLESFSDSAPPMRVYSIN